jgi:hypothetical protein
MTFLAKNFQITDVMTAGFTPRNDMIQCQIITCSTFITFIPEIFEECCTFFLVNFSTPHPIILPTKPKWRFFACASIHWIFITGMAFRNFSFSFFSPMFSPMWLQIFFSQFRRFVSSFVIGNPLSGNCCAFVPDFYSCFNQSILHDASIVYTQFFHYVSVRPFFLNIPFSKLFNVKFHGEIISNAAANEK